MKPEELAVFSKLIEANFTSINAYIMHVNAHAKQRGSTPDQITYETFWQQEQSLAEYNNPS